MTTDDYNKGYEEGLIEGLKRDNDIYDSIYERGINKGKEQTNQNIKKFVEELLEKINFAQEDYGNLDWVSKDQAMLIIGKMANQIFPQIGNQSLQVTNNKGVSVVSAPLSDTSEQKKANKGELLPSSSVSEVNNQNVNPLINSNEKIREVNNQDDDATLCLDSSADPFHFGETSHSLFKSKQEKKQ